MCPGGVPYDGVPIEAITIEEITIEEIKTVSVALTVVYSLFASAGIIFAIVCLAFTLIFKRK